MHFYSHGYINFLVSPTPLQIQSLPTTAVSDKEYLKDIFGPSNPAIYNYMQQISQSTVKIGQVSSCLSFFMDCTQQSLKLLRERVSQGTMNELIQLMGMSAQHDAEKYLVCFIKIIAHNQKNIDYLIEMIPETAMLCDIISLRKTITTDSLFGRQVLYSQHQMKIAYVETTFRDIKVICEVFEWIILYLRR
jgi:hypothetical protein